MFAPGAQVGPYRLGRLLAEGGMAVVHEAVGVDGSARVALKIPRFATGAATEREQVVHEVQAMARLSHPHIVPVLGWGETPDGLLWMAMPLIEDVQLRRYAETATDAEVLSLVDQLLDALAYAHDRGVVHRDIKPKNLLVSRGEGGPRLWLADFGIASLGNALGLRQARAWGASLVLGTPTYMAPEQVRAEPDVGPAADLYSVGVLLYVLFEGRPPFGRSLRRVLEREGTEAPPFFTSAAIREVPRGLQDIVDRLVTDDPLDRYPSAGALRVALRKVAEGQSSARPRRLFSMRGGVVAPAAGSLVPADHPLAGGELSRCPDCGAALVAPGAPCDACESHTVTVLQPDSEAARSSSSRTLSQRAIAVLALATDGADRALCTALVDRAGAHVEWRAPGEEDGAALALIAFGAFSSHGNEVLEAAELALALRGALRGGFAGCGIAAGYGGVWEGSVTGPAAEAAEALLRRARAGAIVVEGSIVDALAPSYGFEDSPGGAELLGLLPSEDDRIDPRGRARELGRLSEIAREAGSGSARAVLVSSRPGMGKSLLLRHLSRSLGTNGWVVLAGRAAVTDAAEPIAVIKAAVRDLAGIPRPASRETTVALLGRVLPGAAARTSDLAQRLAALLDDPVSPASEHAVAGAARARAFDAIGALVDALTAEGPVALLLDDLHFADPSTRDLCAALVERFSRRPLLVVAAAREPAPALPGAEILALGPLDAAAAREIVEQVAGPLPSGEGIDAMIDLAAGTPSLLAEIARLYRQRRALGLAAPLPAAAGPGLSALLQARLDALPADERHVLQVAATVGRSFWVPLLSALADEPIAHHVPEIVRSLVAAHFIEIVPQSSIAGAQEARFVHDAIWEGTAAMLDAAAAAPLHRRAARWLEVHARHLGAGIFRAIADHLRRAGDPGRAAAWSARAGARAEALGSVGEALESYEHAAALLEELAADGPGPEAAGRPLPVDRPALYLALARTSLDGGRPADADRAAELALAVPEPPRALIQAEARRIRADVARARGDTAGALRLLDEAIACVGPDGDRIMRALLLGRRGWILGYVLGDNAEGRASGQKALALLDGLDVPAIESHIHSFLGANELRAGEWDRQLKCNRRALALSTQAGDPVGQVRAHINLSVCFTNRGALSTAAEHASAAIELGRRTGVFRSLIVAVNNLGIIRLDQGAIAEARALLSECVSLSRRYAMQDVLHETLPMLARVHLAEGDLDAARARVEEGRRIAESEGNQVGLALGYRVGALIPAAAGDREGASRSLDRSLAACEAGSDDYEKAVTLLCRALLHGDDTSGIREELARVGADPEVEARRWRPG